MVKIRTEYDDLDQPEVGFDLWFGAISQHASIPDVGLVRKAYEMSLAAQADEARHDSEWGKSNVSFFVGLEMADILAELHLDQDSLMAALLYRAVRENKITLDVIAAALSSKVSGLIEGVQRMAAISMAQHAPKQVLGQADGQLDNVRQMLVAMIDDVRVVLLKLAERTCAIRALKEAGDARRRKVAREVMDIYAPLAHRLGIGHIKWELEDFAFRYLHPKAYKKIATQLDGRRVEREAAIKAIAGSLSEKIQAAGVDAEVSGRVKHIYSIWRKMKRKNLSFHQIYDIRAVRVLVNGIAECYTVLGLVHTLWPHVQHEFDDYIASPKDNGYRSLHTAVIGPNGGILEVQIRTHEMHAESELGVCAHWRYKEGRKSGTDFFEDRVSWLRQVLEWQEEIGDHDAQDTLASLQEEGSDQRVYVFTPDGHIVAMIEGATPLDFAFHVHSEIGHHCRGAKVNGRIVPLNYPLVTGERVEILTAKSSEPRVEWLNPDLGFLQTSRARGRVQQWFRSLGPELNREQGAALLEAECERLAVPVMILNSRSDQLGYESLEELHEALGRGDLQVSQLLGGLESEVLAEATLPDQVAKSATKSSYQLGKSIDSAPTQMYTRLASCCKPSAGEAVRAYTSLGEGVMLHRKDCVELARLEGLYPERIIPMKWGGSDPFYVVGCNIQAYDRSGLLRDVMMILADLSANVLAVESKTNGESQLVTTYISMEIRSLADLSVAFDRIRQLPSIQKVSRAANRA